MTVKPIKAHTPREIRIAAWPAKTSNCFLGESPTPSHLQPPFSLNHKQIAYLVLNYLPIDSNNWLSSPRQIVSVLLDSNNATAIIINAINIASTLKRLVLALISPLWLKINHSINSTLPSFPLFFDCVSLVENHAFLQDLKVPYFQTAFSTLNVIERWRDGSELSIQMHM